MLGDCWALRSAAFRCAGLSGDLISVHVYLLFFLLLLQRQPSAANVIGIVYLKLLSASSNEANLSEMDRLVMILN